MRELNIQETESVSGGDFGLFASGAATLGSIISGNPFATAASSIKFGSEINDELSDQQGMAIGHTVDQIVNSPGSALNTAYNYWL